MTPETLAAFALTSLLIELTPGPNMAYLALIAMTDGRRAGLAAVAGVALGLGVMGAAAGVGLAALLQAQPVLFQTLRWAGVAYLLWLAWDSWKGSDEAAEHAAQGSSLGKFFERGLVTNLLNPKAAIFYVTVLPEFLPTGGGMAAPLTLALIYVAVATAVHAGIVLAASAAQPWLSDEARIRPVRRVMALGLVAVAVWLAMKG